MTIIGINTQEELDQAIERMKAEPSRGQMLDAFALVQEIASHPDMIETVPVSARLKWLDEITRKAAAIVTSHTSRERASTTKT